MCDDRWVRIRWTNSATDGQPLRVNECMMGVSAWLVSVYPLKIRRIVLRHVGDMLISTLLDEIQLFVSYNRSLDIQ